MAPQKRENTVKVVKTTKRTVETTVEPAERVRGWCFTHNNYTEDVCEAYRTVDCQYVCFGKEVAPTTNTPHLQGYIYFSDKKSFSQVREIAGSSIRVAKGNGEQNQTYCKKDGEFYERGTVPMSQSSKGQSEKDKWHEIIRLAGEGKFEEIHDKYPLIYFNKQREIRQMHALRSSKVATLATHDHVWIYGESGSGKSFSARELSGGLHYDKDPATKWWDNYDGEEFVLMDDVGPEITKFSSELKRWLDVYPFPAEVKNGYRNLRPRCIVITSQYHPEEIWKDRKTRDAIMRRVSIREQSHWADAVPLAHAPPQEVTPPHTPRTPREMEEGCCFSP